MTATSDQALPIVFTTHAYDRATERGLGLRLVEDIIRSPSFSGGANLRCRWASGPCLVGTWRAFVTAILDRTETGIAVVTVYVGPPPRRSSAKGP